MLTKDEIQSRFGLDWKYCSNHACTPYETRYPLCEHAKECMADDINRVSDFLLENPEPLTGDFPLFVADSFCQLRYYKCSGCPFQIDDTESLTEIEPLEEWEIEAYGDKRWFCAFGFQEDRDIEDGNVSKDLDHKPDPEALREVLDKVKGRPDSLVDIVNRIVRIAQKDESRYHGLANMFREMLESTDES